MRSPLLSRRDALITTTALVSAALPLAASSSTPAASDTARRFAPQPGPWRRFELTTSVRVADARGETRLWLPVPDIQSDYQQSLGHRWSGNASEVRLVSDARQGVRMLFARFDRSVAAPTLDLVSQVETRSRAAQGSRRDALGEDPALLRQCLQPTRLLPTDGVVRSTALEATRGARDDLQKARKIYDWVIARAHREPKTRGCGTGDIRAMLESGDLGGKCADLNAIFVGLCRAAGIPARDVYGIRLAPSAFGYRELGANSANLKGAQHCRAEVWIAGQGWLAMDPADALKVMRQETSDWIRDPAHPVAAPVVRGLFGGWEGNWLAWNTGHDVVLPGSASAEPLAFLMYPNAEDDSGRFDEVAADDFRYAIRATEIAV